MTVQHKPSSAADPARDCPTKPASEKRREPRYPTHDEAQVRMLPLNGEHLAATIVDISKSGLRLELGSTLLKGSRVEITTSPRKVIIFGEVRYCRRVGGIFNAGILIEGVVAPAGESEAHLLDDEIALFLVGKGLAVPEVLRAKDHISKCDACSRRMAEASATLYPRRWKPAVS